MITAQSDCVNWTPWQAENDERAGRVTAAWLRYQVMARSTGGEKTFVDAPPRRSDIAKMWYNWHVADLRPLDASIDIRLHHEGEIDARLKETDCISLSTVPISLQSLVPTSMEGIEDPCTIMSCNRYKQQSEHEMTGLIGRW